MEDKDYSFLYEAIPEGKEKAVSNADLQESLHLKRRDVYRLIHEARCNGFVVCSGNYGYYRPKTKEEYIEGYNTLWRMATSLLSALKAQRKIIKHNGWYPETIECKYRNTVRNRSNRE